jgi:hypothetical protein
MIKDRMDLMSTRHTRLIEDPFPEHSAYNAVKQMLDENRSPLERLFRMKFPDIGIPKPEAISIWAAYRKGYDKAYAEIEARLDPAQEAEK